MRSESGNESRRRARGAGNGGMFARLGKRVILRGEFSYEFDKSELGRYSFCVYGDLEFNGKPYLHTKVFDFKIRPVGENLNVDVLFPCEPINLKAIKLFRELLSRFLEKMKDCQELPDPVKQCLGVYLVDFKKYSDAKSMLDQINDLLKRLDLENVDDVDRLKVALFALDSEIECEVKLEVQD